MEQGLPGVVSGIKRSRAVVCSDNACESTGRRNQERFHGKGKVPNDRPSTGRCHDARKAADETSGSTDRSTFKNGTAIYQRLIYVARIP